MFQMSIYYCENVECEQFLTIFIFCLIIQTPVSNILCKEYCGILNNTVITSNLQIFHVYLLGMSSLAAKFQTW